MAANKRRITERVAEKKPAAERRRSPQKPSRNSVTAGFTSFPYRDKERLLAVEKLRDLKLNKYLTAIDGFSLKSLPQPPLQSSKYNAKLMVKDEGQDPRSPSEFVSLEDKQVLTDISHQKHPLILFYPRVGRKRL